MCPHPGTAPRALQAFRRHHLPHSTRPGRTARSERPSHTSRTTRLTHPLHPLVNKQHRPIADGRTIAHERHSVACPQGVATCRHPTASIVLHALDRRMTHNLRHAGQRIVEHIAQVGPQRPRQRPAPTRRRTAVQIAPIRRIGEHLIQALGNRYRISRHVGQKPLRPHSRHTRMRAQIRPNCTGDLCLQGIFQNRSQIAHDGHDRARATLATHIAKIVVAQQHVDSHAAPAMLANPFRIILHGV